MRGEVTVVPDTDDPDRFVRGAVLTTDDGREVTIRSVKPYRDRGLIVAFEGVVDRPAAERLRGAMLTVTVADRRALGDGEYWPDQLVGLEARSPTGELLGTVTGVDFGTAQDRLVVSTTDGVEVLVPFVDQIVGDPVAGAVVIDAPTGLFPGPDEPDA